jgi:hypothetical protein
MILDHTFVTEFSFVADVAFAFTHLFAIPAHRMTLFVTLNLVAGVSIPPWVALAAAEHAIQERVKL